MRIHHAHGSVTPHLRTKMRIFAALMASIFSRIAVMMPLNVAATSVKLAMPPPISRARPRPSGANVAVSSTVLPATGCKT